MEPHKQNQFVGIFLLVRSRVKLGIVGFDSPELRSIVLQKRQGIQYHGKPQPLRKIAVSDEHIDDQTFQTTSPPLK